MNNETNNEPNDPNPMLSDPNNPTLSDPKKQPMFNEIKSMAEHDTLLLSAKPVMICFKATWCLPCKTIDPFLVDFATNNPWAEVRSVNIDINPDLVKKYSILKLPTTIFFKAGVEVGERRFGVITKIDMDMRLKSLI